MINMPEPQTAYADDFVDFVPMLVIKVRELAKKNPEFVYTKNDFGCGCNYRPDDGNPCGCIVGGGARLCGVELAGHDVSPSGARHDILDQFNENDKTIVEFYGTTMNQDLDWLDAVQGFQDAGQTWANAIKMADGEANEA